MRKNEHSEYEQFVNITDALLRVPHSEIQKREKKYKDTAAKNPHKRGPKPKAKK